MAYDVQLDPGALRSLKKLPRDIQKEITNQAKALADDPCPPGVEKVADVKHGYRIRIGDYRMAYGILNDHNVVYIVRIGHRSEVYKDLVPMMNRSIRKYGADR